MVVVVVVVVVVLVVLVVVTIAVLIMVALGIEMLSIMIEALKVARSHPGNGSTTVSRESQVQG